MKENPKKRRKKAMEEDSPQLTEEPSDEHDQVVR